MGSIYDPFDTPLNLPLINKICNFVYSGMEERLCRMFMFTMMPNVYVYNDVYV